MLAPSRTPAAHTALTALLRAIPPDGALWLMENEPATASIGKSRVPLGRAPLSLAAIDLLLASPELAVALAQGPGAAASWRVQVGDKSLQAQLTWPVDGKWSLSLGAAPPGPPPLPAASAALPAAPPSMPLAQAAAAIAAAPTKADAPRLTFAAMPQPPLNSVQAPSTPSATPMRLASPGQSLSRSGAAQPLGATLVPISAGEGGKALAPKPGADGAAAPGHPQLQPETFDPPVAQALAAIQARAELGVDAASQRPAAVQGTQPSPSVGPAQHAPVEDRTGAVDKAPSDAAPQQTVEAPLSVPDAPLADGAQPQATLAVASAAATPEELGSEQSTAALPAALLTLLALARSKQASDLHLQAGQPPRYRIFGRLAAEGEPLAAADTVAFAEAVLTPDLRSTLTQTGSVDLALAAAPHGRFRLNIGRESNGHKLCFRLLSDAPASLRALGLPDEVEAVANYHQGLAIFSGPRGHGKTTTMAAVVNLINERSATHILTVEDPIEVVHAPKKAVVSQREVGTHTRSFARALKAALREDPDIIVIGELRDRKTVEIALSAAETGHLVLATMSTRSAAKAVDRLIDLFPPDEQPQVRATLAGALKMIVSQRLLPKRNGELVPAVEIVTGSVPLWTLIRENKLYQLPSLQQRGKSIGMLRMDASLEALVASGDVQPAVAHAAAENPPELLRLLHDKHGYRPEAAAAEAGSTAKPPASPPAKD